MKSVLNSIPFLLISGAICITLSAKPEKLKTTNKSPTAFGFNFDGSLDKEAISHAYFEGDFAKILPPLETYRQPFPSSAKKEDSIFVYKYLSVIYAADSTQRQKAESFMVQLIKIMPTIELIDLYISDNIESIFKNVKQSYEKNQAYVKSHDQYGQETKTNQKDSGQLSKKETATIEKPSHQFIWWTVAGAGIIAAATTYLVLSHDSSPTAKVDTIKP